MERFLEKLSKPKSVAVVLKLFLSPMASFYTVINVWLGAQLAHRGSRFPASH